MKNRTEVERTSEREIVVTRSFDAPVRPTRWSKVALAESLSVARIGMRG